MGKASPPVLQSKHKGLISTKSWRCSYPGPTQLLLMLTSWQGDWASVPGLCASSHIPLLAPGSVWFLGLWQLAPAVIECIYNESCEMRLLTLQAPSLKVPQRLWPCRKYGAHVPRVPCAPNILLFIFSPGHSEGLLSRCILRELFKRSDVLLEHISCCCCYPLGNSRNEHGLDGVGYGLNFHDVTCKGSWATEVADNHIKAFYWDAVTIGIILLMGAKH